MELIQEQGIDDFIEVGPGRVLKGIWRRIDRNVNCYTTQNIDSLNKTMEKLKNGGT